MLSELCYGFCLMFELQLLHLQQVSEASLHISDGACGDTEMWRMGVPQRSPTLSQSIGAVLNCRQGSIKTCRPTHSISRKPDRAVMKIKKYDTHNNCIRVLKSKGQNLYKYNTVFQLSPAVYVSEILKFSVS